MPDGAGMRVVGDVAVQGGQAGRELVLGERGERRDGPVFEPLPVRLERGGDLVGSAAEVDR